MTITLTCSWTNPPHEHEYPDDWEFGGVDNLDPRVDSRWVPTSYEYWSDDFQKVWVTQVPICEDAALDYFTWVRDTFRLSGKNPKYLFIRTKTSWAQSPWEYDAAEDLLTPLALKKDK